jgi:hypothetical protein
MKMSRDKSNDCSCIGDTLTFECTVMSELATIWRGSALNCASGDNGLILFNTSVQDKTCNEDLITGRVIKREGDNYTSQLNVIFSSDLIGKNVECASDNGLQNLIVIFNTTLDIRTW